MCRVPRENRMDDRIIRADRPLTFGKDPQSKGLVLNLLRQLPHGFAGTFAILSIDVLQTG